MNCPADTIKYSYICDQFPEPTVFFENYESAVSFAKFDQPTNRPYYIVECVTTFEICGLVGKNRREKKINNKGAKHERSTVDRCECA